MKLIELKPIIIIIFSIGLLSCQKKDATVPEPDVVNINISSPQDGTTYKKGDTIRIEADISYISQMHGYIVQITDTNGKVVYEAESHSHGDNITVDEHWGDTLSYNTGLYLVLTAVIDHDGNKKMAKVGFNSQP